MTPTRDEAWFEQVERLRPLMEIPADDKHAIEARRAYARRHHVAYGENVRLILMRRFAILEKGLIYPFLGPACPDAPFSGAMTFFSRIHGKPPRHETHKGRAEAGVRARDRPATWIADFLNWEKGVPKRVNSGCIEHICHQRQGTGSCAWQPGDEPNYYDRNCLPRCLGEFLDTLDFSATRMVDRTLPNKGAFYLDLSEMPSAARKPDSAQAAEAFHECVALQGALRGKQSAANVPLVQGRDARFIDWDEDAEPHIRGVISEKLRVFVPYFRSLFMQLSGLYLFSPSSAEVHHHALTATWGKENLQRLASLGSAGGRPKGYRLSDFLDLVLGTLIVPEVDYFYFFHFGPGRHPDPSKHGDPAVGSGTLVLNSYCPLPVELRSGIMVLTQVAMSSITRMEHTLIETDTIVGQVAHTVSNWFANTAALVRTAPPSPEIKEALHRLEQMRTLMQGINLVVRGGEDREKRFPVEPAQAHTLMLEGLRDVREILAHDRGYLFGVFGDRLEVGAARTKLRRLIPDPPERSELEGRVETCRIVVVSMMLEGVKNALESLEKKEDVVEVASGRRQGLWHITLTNRVKQARRDDFRRAKEDYANDTSVGLGLQALKTYSRILEVPEPEFGPSDEVCEFTFYVGRVLEVE